MLAILPLLAAALWAGLAAAADTERAYQEHYESRGEGAKAFNENFSLGAVWQEGMYGSDWLPKQERAAKDKGFTFEARGFTGSVASRDYFVPIKLLLNHTHWRKPGWRLPFNAFEMRVSLRSFRDYVCPRGPSNPAPLALRHGQKLPGESDSGWFDVDVGNEELRCLTGVYRVPRNLCPQVRAQLWLEFRRKDSASGVLYALQKFSNIAAFKPSPTYVHQTTDPQMKRNLAQVERMRQNALYSCGGTFDNMPVRPGAFTLRDLPEEPAADEDYRLVPLKSGTRFFGLGQDEATRRREPGSTTDARIAEARVAACPFRTDPPRPALCKTMGAPAGSSDRPACALVDAKFRRPVLWRMPKAPQDAAACARACDAEALAPLEAGATLACCLGDGAPKLVRHYPAENACAYCRERNVLVGFDATGEAVCAEEMLSSDRSPLKPTLRKRLTPRKKL
ncbi:MAG: hypothetical protein HY078_01950 [Elusimicrobia bacterium]|nr:hypothetical protein [Elusimicrobiota bacterium]